MVIEDMATLALAGVLVVALGITRAWSLLRSQNRAAAASDQRALYDSEKILRAVAQHANDGLVYQDMQGRILWANDAYCRIMGYRLEEILGRRPQEYCFPLETRPSDAEIMNFVFDPDADEFHELTRRLNMRKNGERFWHEFNLSLIQTDAGEQRVILVSRDVTEQVNREEELERTKAELHHAATHDVLTGLSNRAAFQTRAAAALHEHGEIGVMYIDLDKFKTVNDTLGHAAGDAILIHAAESIRSALPAGSISCRVGGDEFLCACPGVGDLAALEYIADTLLERITTTLAWNTNTLEPRASIGLAAADTVDTLIPDLIRMADFALYEAKVPGAPAIMRYDASLHARKEAESAMVDDFIAALDHDKLEFLFQPIIGAPDMTPVGFETLVRWRRTENELLLPGQFLDIASRLKRLPDIDFRAAAAAAQLTSDLRARGHILCGAFNVAPDTLGQSDFRHRLQKLLDAHALPTDALIIEVLETTLFGPDATDSPAADCISMLRQMGIKVFLDDFGTGYAGLAHLGQLDVSGIKIDRSLSKDVSARRPASLIAGSILQLAHELSIEVCVEGIETYDQAEFFAQHGCQKFQGFGYARPMEKAAFVAWIENGASDLLAPVATAG
ncbi:MAG: EAL domain-containing protein [Pseudomonadota bacterium]